MFFLLVVVVVVGGDVVVPWDAWFLIVVELKAHTMLPFVFKIFSEKKKQQ